MKKSFFCDNDMLTINPPDLIPLAKYLKNKTKKTGIRRDIDAYERILNCMMAYVRYKIQTNYQIGLEHRRDMLSIIEPNIARAELEKYIVGTILSTPEDGVVFRSIRGKGFFRARDAHKYSDELIKIIQAYCEVQGINQENMDYITETTNRIHKSLELTQRIRALTRQFFLLATKDVRAPF